MNGKTTDVFTKEMAQETGLSEAEIVELLSIEVNEDESGYKLEFRDDRKYLTGDRKGKYNERGTWRSGEDRTLIISYSTDNSVEFTVASLKSDAATLLVDVTDTKEIEGKEYDIRKQYYYYLKK